MKVTKYEHATLVVESADRKLVIDPGSFLTPPDFAGTVAVVITHEHADHWTPDNLRRIREISPDAAIYGPQGVATAAEGYDVHVVADGDAVEAGPFRLRFFGAKHNEIHSSLPIVDNVGVLVNDELYYPGDSYTVPEGVEVGTLVAPVGGPWLKIGEAMDYVLAVEPKRAFFAHDMTLSVAGRTMHADRLRWATEEHGGTWMPLEVGQSLDL